MAARIETQRASARNQALHYFVAKAEWSDLELMRRVCQWVMSPTDFGAGGLWIMDYTEFAKKGRYAAGVARQYCSFLGKQDSCRVAESVSLACDGGRLPVAWQLYLPQEWADDPERRAAASVPPKLGPATKTEIALRQLRQLLQDGAPRHCMLADAGYDVDTALQQALTDMGLQYVVGITSSVVVSPPGVKPLSYSGRGRAPARRVEPRSCSL